MDISRDLSMDIHIQGNPDYIISYHIVSYINCSAPITD